MKSIITEATKGYGEKLAALYGRTPGRMYQILEADFYGKTMRLIRVLGTLDKSRVRLIKTDIDATFDEVLGEDTPVEVDCAYLHAELGDVIQARLNKLTSAERLKECREAAVALAQEIAFLERQEGVKCHFPLYEAAARIS